MYYNNLLKGARLMGKIIFKRALSFFMALILVFSVISICDYEDEAYPAKRTEAASNYNKIRKSKGYKRSKKYAKKVLKLVNKERVKRGRTRLKLNERLCVAAYVRSKEIVRYFSHDRPSGKSFSTVFTKYGIKYYYAGENIAAGYDTPKKVMYGWMHSKGHKKNILKKEYKYFGCGYYYKSSATYRYYWSQEFGAW
ncbi:MAG: CAP domain-containing protein [Lachnospiraceae bacterium]|nr:CAP domain-containing protein [Lachnospiraceae bacterium]